LNAVFVIVRSPRGSALLALKPISSKEMKRIILVFILTVLQTLYRNNDTLKVTKKAAET